MDLTRCIHSAQLMMVTIEHRTKHVYNDQQRHRKLKLDKQGAVANIVERHWKMLNKKGTEQGNIDARTVQQTQINPKHNKNTPLTTSLLNLYNWE